MEKKVTIKTENGETKTFKSEGTVKNYKKAIEGIKSYNAQFNSIGVDYEHFLTKPQMVKVTSIFDKCVKDILGDDYEEIIDSITEQVEAHQCHSNAGVAGEEIFYHFDCDIDTYFCGGFFGYNDIYNETYNAHCIIYIERDGQGAFIDPTELVWDEKANDSFQLFYFAPILAVTCDLFEEYEQAYNPIFGYNEQDLVDCKAIA